MPRALHSRPSRWIAAVALVVAVLPVMAADNPEDAARRVLAEQRDAWNRADIDAFMKGYWRSETIRFAGGDSIQSGWQGTIDRYRKAYPDATAMGKLDFDLVEVRALSPTVVYVFGKWHLTRATDAADKAPHGLFTLIVEKKGDGWFVTRDHTSSASN